MTRILPILFILLWSSAFITSKIIVEHATPFASLFFRFIIVSFGFLILLLYEPRIFHMHLQSELCHLHLCSNQFVFQ